MKRSIVANILLNASALTVFRMENEFDARQSENHRRRCTNDGSVGGEIQPVEQRSQADRHVSDQPIANEHTQPRC